MARRRTALVTGGAVRIGRAIVEALAAEGFDVVIHCRRSTDEAAALARRISRKGNRAWVVQADLDSEAGVTACWHDAVRAARGLDVLVNSAAVFGRADLGETTAAGLLGEFWPNLFAPVLLTRFFAEQRRSDGAVINLLDRRIAAHDTSRIPYSLTKHALAEFTRTAALALAPGIRVNAVAPGPALPPPGESAAYLKTRAGRIPLQKPCGPESIARAVIALLDMPATTGQILFVDGGQHLLGNGA